MYAQTTKKFNDTTYLQPVEVQAIRADDKAPFAKTNLNKKEIEKNNLGQDLPFLLNQTPAAVVNADAGLPSEQDTAIAKAYCNQTGFEAATEAMQVLGGIGYSEESLVEYCFRRTRGWMIAGGSVEIMKNWIAEGVFGRDFSQRAQG